MMKIEKLLGIFLVLAMVLGTSSLGIGAEALLKDYDVLVVQNLTVPSGSPAPESSG